jgi:exodeoxyribonuclease VII small subunit
MTPRRKNPQLEHSMEDSKHVKKFDHGMAELEAIVARLETGDLPLEEALATFEAGIALVRTLNQRLTEAEARIELLSHDAQGAVRLRPVSDQELKE